MKTRTITVTKQDLERLRALIEDSRKSGTEEPEALRALERELAEATVVEPNEVPNDVVTMNSTVRVSVAGSKRSMSWTVVYPKDADLDENRVSVLAPIGMALLGYRLGDEIEWNVPAGRRVYRIEEIIRQPEATGDFES